MRKILTYLSGPILESLMVETGILISEIIQEIAWRTFDKNYSCFVLMTGIERKYYCKLGWICNISTKLRRKESKILFICLGETHETGSLETKLMRSIL